MERMASLDGVNLRKRATDQGGTVTVQKHPRQGLRNLAIWIVIAGNIFGVFLSRRSPLACGYPL